MFQRICSQTSFLFILLVFGAFTLNSCAQDVFVNPTAGNCADIAPANTGNGLCTISVVSFAAKSENLTFTATTAGPVATFSVTGSTSGSLGTIKSGSIQNVADSNGNPVVSVQISDGGTPFVVGDDFQVTLQAGTELTAEAFNEFDLEEVCSNGCDTQADLTLTGGVIKISNGTVALPAYSFIADPDKGFYSDALGVLDVTVDGSQVGSWVGDSVAGAGAANFRVPTGTGGQPGLAFVGDSDTGLKRASSNQLELMTAGVTGLSLHPNQALVLGAPGSTQTHRIIGSQLDLKDSFSATRISFDVDGVKINYPTSSGVLNAIGGLYLNVDSNANDTSSVFEIGTNRDGTSGGEVWYGINSNGESTIGVAAGSRAHKINAMLAYEFGTNASSGNLNPLNPWPGVRKLTSGTAKTLQSLNDNSGNVVVNNLF